MAGTALRRRLSWQGATLTARVRETDRAATLHLELDGWAGHRAGQHVDVRLTAPDGYSTQRSYSIASAPAPGALDLTVQEVDDGEVSPFLARDLAIGDAVELRGPIGGWFVYDPPAAPEPAGERPVLLLAGGSGVVPLMSMIRARGAAGDRTPFRLVYYARSAADTLYADELTRRTDAGLECALIHTRVSTPGAARPAGRITADDLVRFGWGVEDRPRLYVCGPTAFVEVAARLLTDAGHPADQIRTERFG